MANLQSIARPYALAAFESARESQQLLEWKAFLEAASVAAKQPQAAKFLDNPEVMSTWQFELFHEVLKPLLDDQRKNFLLLLAQNKRLIVLPDIAEAYNAYYAALEKISKVRIVTAIEIQEEFKETLSNALAKRIERKVTLHCEVDPAIIGGAIIHMGDRVIDGSVRGKLTRMLQSLTG